MAYIRVKLMDILNHPSNIDETGKRIITQKNLAEKIGLHQSVVSGIARDTKDSINKIHLAKIMKALNITDFNKILELVDDEEK